VCSSDLALGIAAVALWGFIWATRSGQFDDLETPGYRAIFDDVAVDDPPADDAVNTEDEARATQPPDSTQSQRNDRTPSP